MSICPKCGVQLPDDAQFCPRCGEKIAPAAPEVQPPVQQPEEFAPTMDMAEAQRYFAELEAKRAAPAAPGAPVAPETPMAPGTPVVPAAPIVPETPAGNFVPTMDMVDVQMHPERLAQAQAAMEQPAPSESQPAPAPQEPDDPEKQKSAEERAMMNERGFATAERLKKQQEMAWQAQAQAEAQAGRRKKKVIFGVIAAVIVVLAVVIGVKMSGNSESGGRGVSIQPTPTPDPTATPTPRPTAAPTPRPTAAPVLTGAYYPDVIDYFNGQLTMLSRHESEDKGMVAEFYVMSIQDKMAAQLYLEEIKKNPDFSLLYGRGADSDTMVGLDKGTIYYFDVEGIERESGAPFELMIATSNNEYVVLSVGYDSRIKGQETKLHSDRTVTDLSEEFRQFVKSGESTGSDVPAAPHLPELSAYSGNAIKLEDPWEWSVDEDDDEVGQGIYQMDRDDLPILEAYQNYLVDSCGLVLTNSEFNEESGITYYYYKAPGFSEWSFDFAMGVVDFETLDSIYVIQVTYKDLRPQDDGARYKG